MDAELFEAEEVEVDVEPDPESFDDVDDVDEVSTASSSTALRLSLIDI